MPEIIQHLKNLPKSRRETLKYLVGFIAGGTVISLTNRQNQPSTDYTPTDQDINELIAKMPQPDSNNNVVYAIDPKHNLVCFDIENTGWTCDPVVLKENKPTIIQSHTSLPSINAFVSAANDFDHDVTATQAASYPLSVFADVPNPRLQTPPPTK